MSLLDPIHRYLMIGKLIVLLGTIAIICWQSSQIHRWHTHYNAERQAHVRDIDAYRAAQAAAAAQNQAHVAQENKLREQINETSRSSFIADRDRLRREAAKGASGSTGVPGVPKGTPGTAPEAVPLPPAELLRAQETELQLNALIDWVLQQSKIDPNK